MKTAKRFLSVFWMLIMLCAAAIPASALTKIDTEIEIVNFTEERTVDYRTTIKLTAKADHIPSDKNIVWIVKFDDGSETYSIGETLTMAEVKSGFSVCAGIGIIDLDGAKVSAKTDTEHITVKKGFFDRLKAFFRSLFRRLPIITQEYLGMEIYE